MGVELLEPTQQRLRDLIGFPLVDADIAVGANINAAKIGTGIISTAEFNQLDGITSAVVGIDDTQTLTNKTLTTPTIASFVNATHSHLNAAGGGTITKAAISDTPWAKADLPATTVYTDQANTYGVFAQRFPTTQLQLDNPAATFQYIFATSAIIADRTVTLPLLTGNDTFVFNAFAATLTNKTLTLGANTISGTAAQFDIAVTDDNFAYVSDNLSVFAATTSLQLLGVISDEAGSGLLVFNDTPTILTPTIASFVNATHDHSNAAGGGLITAAAVSDFDTQVRTSRLDQMATPTASVSFGNQLITLLLDPVSAQDAATKNYVDAIAINGVKWKESARIATTTNDTLSGLAARDGITPIAGDRVLVKNQTLGENNGLYDAAVGAWTRSTDADTAAEILQMAVFIEEGTANADQGFVLTTNAPIVLGTTVLVYTQFTGLGQITAGAGLTKTANTLDVGGTTNRISISADAVDIDSAYVGQASIITLGTIVTGVWEGTVIDEAFLDANVVLNNKANVFGDFDQTFKDNRLRIANPADTFFVNFQTSAEIANRVLTIPLLGANRTIVVTGLTSQIVIGTEVTGASTALTDTDDIAYLNQANTFGAFLNSFVSSSMRIPLSATPTMAVDGDFAIDTTITDFSMGLIKYFDGEEMVVVSMPVAEIVTPTNATVVTYNATTDEFELVAPPGGEFLGPWTADHDAGGFDLLNVGGIQINNPADTFQYIITPAAIIADRIVNLPLLTATDTITMDAFGTTLTNKTMTAGANTFSGFAIGAEVTGASTDLTDTGVIVRTDQANTFGLFDQQFKTSRLIIRNPADTFGYLFAGSAIIANRTVTLPLLTANANFIMTAGLSSQTISTDLLLGAGNDLTIQASGATGFIDIEEITTPANPAVNLGRLYTKDLATVTTLFFRDSSGTETNVLTGSEVTTWTADHDANTFALLDARFADDVDATKIIDLNLSGMTTGIVLTLSTSQTTAQTLTIPNTTGADDFVLEDFTQTLTNKTLTTPTIASFVNATHDHSNAAGGGNLTNSALTSGVFAAITGVGAQSQPLNMNGFDINNVEDIELDETGSVRTIFMKRAEALVDDTIIAEIKVQSNDGVPTVEDFGNIVFTMESDAVGSEDGSIKLQVAQAGVHRTNFITLNDASSGTIELLKPTNITGNLDTSGTFTAGTYVGQSSIITLGTITTGVWNGTAITGANINAASTDLTDTADIAYLNTANTFIAGNKNTFAHSATTAGIAVLPVAGNPSGQADGDIWLNVTSQQLFARINGANVDLGAAAGGSQTPWLSNIDAATFELLNLGAIELNNPADTFQYRIIGSAITADRTLTLPLLLANADLVVTAGLVSQRITIPTEFESGDLQVNNPANTFQYRISGSTIIADRVVTIPNVTGPSNFMMVSNITQNIDSDKRFQDTNFQLNNPANTFQYIFSTSAITADRTITMPLLAGNSLIAMLEIANTWGDFDQTFKDDKFLIANPADTFIYKFIASAIVGGNKNVTLPLLTGNDTFTMDAFAATLSNKTLDNTNEFSGFVDFAEIATPASPAANEARLFAADVGGNTHIFQDNSTEAPIDLTTGSEVTTWTADHNAANFSLLNFSSLRQNGTEAVAGAIRLVFDATISWRNSVDSNDNFIDFNGDTFGIAFNGVEDYAFTGTGSSWNGNAMGSVGRLEQNGTEATTGFIRMVNNEDIGWRNAANSNNILLGVNVADQIIFDINGTTEFLVASTAITLAAGNNILMAASGGLGYIQMGALTTPVTPGNGLGLYYQKEVATVTTPFFIGDDGVEIDLSAGGSTSFIGFTADANLVMADFDITAKPTPSTDFFEMLVEVTAGDDAGGETMYRINLRRDTPAAITTRNLFEISNNGVAQLTMVAGGNVDFEGNNLQDIGDISPTNLNGVAIGSYVIGTDNISAISASTTAQFNTALTGDSFFFISQNISNMATSTSAQFNAANSDGTFLFLADQPFLIDGTEVSGTVSTTLIMGTNILQFQDVNTSIQGVTNALQYDVVVTTGTHDFRINNALQFQIASDGDLQLQNNSIDFNTDGHNITPAPTSLSINASVDTDLLRLQTGGASRIIMDNSEVDIFIQLNMNNNFVINSVFNNTNEFEDNALIIQNPANTFNYIFQSSAILADRIVTIPLLTVGADLIVSAGLTLQTITIPTAFEDQDLQLNNPANTFQYIFGTKAIIADRIINIPLIAGTRTFALADKGTDAASLDTVTLTITGHYFDITGATTINHINNTNWEIGSVIIIQFDSTPTVNHNTGGEAGDEASIILAGAVNFVAVAGNTLTIVLESSTKWREIARNVLGGGGGGAPTVLFAAYSTDAVAGNEFYIVNGGNAAGSSTEADQQAAVAKAVTFQRMGFEFSVITGTCDSDFRVDGATVNQTITTTVIGFVQDTTNSDTITLGQEVSFNVIETSGNVTVDSGTVEEVA